MLKRFFPLAEDSYFYLIALNVVDQIGLELV